MEYNTTIAYNNLSEVTAPKNAPTLNMLMDNWTLEERLDKYMEFCHAWDKREDPILKHYTQFSHRLHWDENPFGDLIRALDDVRDKIYLTIVYSFTNEHWVTTEACFNSIINGTKFEVPETKHSRHDLFQVWFPKGTKVKNWLETVPYRVSRGLLFEDKQYKIMEFAYLLRDHMMENEAFRNVLYPCKNMSRNLGMAFPDLIDPDSFVVPGTGSYRGYYQLFGGDYLMNKAKFDRMGDPANVHGQTLLDQFHTLINHPNNPVYKHQYINHEDKPCFFYKHIAMTVGYMKMRSTTPIELIVPDITYLKEFKEYNCRQ